jgi:DNA-directed RNA polymerase subunit RPC12/RpoP
MLYLKCSCQACGAHIEFPEAGIGEVVDCPHCGAKTTLSAPAPKSSWKLLAIGGVGLLILVLLGIGGVLYLRKLRSKTPPAVATIVKTVETNAPPPAEPPFVETEIQQFRVGKITLEQAEFGGISYAIGTVKNASDRQRFGVKIMLDELDQADHTVGSTSDYIAVMEPAKEWRFKAMLTDPRAVKVRLTGIREQ